MQVTTYRVEKDGVTFYIQPQDLPRYAKEGYQIFKTVEEKIDDPLEEVRSVIESGANQPSIGEEQIANG